MLKDPIEEYLSEDSGTPADAAFRRRRIQELDAAKKQARFVAKAAVAREEFKARRVVAEPVLARGGFDKLLAEGERCERNYAEAEARGAKALCRSLKVAYKLYLHISSNEAVLEAFLAHPAWEGRPPSPAKLMLAAVKFTTCPQSAEGDKAASKHARALMFFLHRRVRPKDLVAAIKGTKGGLTKAAAFYAEMRKRVMAAADPDATADPPDDGAAGGPGKPPRRQAAVRITDRYGEPMELTAPSGVLAKLQRLLAGKPGDHILLTVEVTKGAPKLVRARRPKPKGAATGKQSAEKSADKASGKKASKKRRKAAAKAAKSEH